MFFCFANIQYSRAKCKVESVRYVHVKCENWTTTSGELIQVQFYSSDFSLQSNYDA